MKDAADLHRASGQVEKGMIPSRSQRCWRSRQRSSPHLQEGPRRYWDGWGAGMSPQSAGFTHEGTQGDIKSAHTSPDPHAI